MHGYVWPFNLFGLTDSSQYQLTGTLPSRNDRNWYHSHQIFTLGTLISFFLGLVLLGSVEFFVCHSPAL